MIFFDASKRLNSSLSEEEEEFGSFLSFFTFTIFLLDFFDTWSLIVVLELKSITAGVVIVYTVKYNYFFSIIEPCFATFNNYELFDSRDIWRFDTLKEAKEYAKSLLK